MQNLIPMSFEGREIRVVDVDGEPWFVGKDVAEALGYTNPNKAMGDHCKGVTNRYPLSTAGGMQDVRILSEPDVLRLIVSSKLPEAQRFEAWVFETVLPQIRKTGRFAVSPGPGARRRRDVRSQLGSLSREFRAGIELAQLAGLSGNQAILGGAKAVRQTTGADVLELVGSTHLLAEEQVLQLTPTELGKQVGESGMAFNRRLERAGLQVKHINGPWMPTDAGKPYAKLLDTGKKHSDGTPVQQLKWLETVLDVLTAPAPQTKQPDGGPKMSSAEAIERCKDILK